VENACSASSCRVECNDVFGIESEIQGSEVVAHKAAEAVEGGALTGVRLGPGWRELDGFIRIGKSTLVVILRTTDCAGTM
jgi:hypothetical protein